MKTHSALQTLISVALLLFCACREASMSTTPISAKRVLFVCVENANRSQMAEAFAKRHGQGTIEAYSAGSRPSGRVNPRAVEFMRELGYDLTVHQSKGLTNLPDVEFDVVVTMGCGDECPIVRAKRREDWNIPDPKDLQPEEFRAVRDLIEKKVKTLLREYEEGNHESHE
jgi:arsenate reductase